MTVHGSRWWWLFGGLDVGGDLFDAGRCLGEVVSVFERSGQGASPVVGGGLRLFAVAVDSAVQLGEPGDPVFHLPDPAGVRTCS